MGQFLCPVAGITMSNIEHFLEIFDAAARQAGYVARLLYYPHNIQFMAWSAMLLDVGYPNEAEAVYAADLRKNPKISYSLFGLRGAVDQQGRHEDAVIIAERNEMNHKNSDFQRLACGTASFETHIASETAIWQPAG
jgi:hypothetical protein